MPTEISLIEVASELGAGTRGASLGPEAIRRACLDFAQHPLFQLEEKKVPVMNELLHHPDSHLNAHRVHGISEMWHRISIATAECIQADKMPLVIAGDHSNAGGTIAGLRKAYPNERIGVVWIDAHADVHSPYTTPSGNVHGMPLAAVLGDDNTECQRNQPHEDSIAHWEKMKHSAGEAQMIQASDLFFLGIRDLEQQEIDFLKRLNIQSMTVEEVRDQGVDQSIKKVMEYFGEIDRLYISFDVDSLDPSLSRGTGTPVDNGFTATEGLDMILSLIETDCFSCLEITEVNPLLDSENKMAKLVASYLTSIIPAIQEKIDNKDA